MSRTGVMRARAEEAAKQRPTTGVLHGLPDAEYHAMHDRLSASGIKKLLPPSCPAKFKAAMDAGEEYKAEFDFGKVAHSLVLGQGAQFEVVMVTAKDGTASEAETYKPPSAQAHRDEIRAVGKVPILAKHLEIAQAMAARIREHEVAAALFKDGAAEVSALWDDPDTRVPCRARFDWLPEAKAKRRTFIPDYKTATSAHPDKFAKAVAEYGYHLQQEHYLDAARFLALGNDPMFLFVVQEKDPPFEVNVIPLDADAAKTGRALNDRARRLFAECTATGHWPGYTPDDQVAEPIALPGYYAYQIEEYLNS